MNQRKASDLWRYGKTLCAQSHYKKGLVLLEKAAALNPAYREPLSCFYLNLYKELISGAVSSNDFSRYKLHKLWQRGKTLLSSNDNSDAADSKQARPLEEYYYQDKLPASFYSGGPYEGWYRLKHSFKQYSLFAPINPLKMEPIVEPDATEILQQLPKSLPQKVLSFIKQLFLPLIIMLVIQLIIYGGIVFFSYFGAYMGWN